MTVTPTKRLIILILGITTNLSLGNIPSATAKNAAPAGPFLILSGASPRSIRPVRSPSILPEIHTGRHDMDTTARFNLPCLLPNQAQKHVTLNDSLSRLDLLNSLIIRSR